MSQDIVRQFSQRGPAGLAASADDIWAQQNGLGPVAMQSGNEVQPLKMVHRSLRGRYKLAFVLAAAGAVCGMVLGWTSFEKTYRAKGYVRISPETISVSGNRDVQSDYQRYMGSEAMTLSSTDIAKRALANSDWNKVVNGARWDVGQFAARIKSSFIGTTNYIDVSFDHPDSRVAVAGMQAVLAAYEDYRTEQLKNSHDMSEQFIETQKRDVQDAIEAAKNRIAEINRDSAKGNIEERAAAKAKQLTDLEAQYEQASLVLQQMLKAKDKALKQPTQVSEQVLIAREPFFGLLIRQRDLKAADLTKLMGVQSPSSPLVLRAQSELDSYNKQIAALAATLSKGSYGVISRLDGREGYIEVNDAVIANQQDDVDTLKSHVESVTKDVEVVDSARYEINDQNNKIDSKTKLLDDINARLAIAQARSLTVNAPFRTFADPVIAVQEDKRPTMATFGFVVGGGLPLLGLVLYGLFDRKFRYSDETTQSGGTRGVPLLGILPNLPDRLSDPSQASVAAHCVHQIRTMLQLNCLDDGPSVLAVTSATSGDGKTSLSLALGLSFAASGSRTLLIDTDLIGAGLSARLGIHQPTGVNEAIMTRDPIQFVRETDVTDLSVLPVGSEGAQNASAFSPNAVRRMIESLRKHFDLILIDTGPVLGSLEATPVVAASDAVILTVSRGQNRDLVEKAIAQVRAVGARIAGVVFNRANARDFERSISGISLRSVSRASSNGVNGNVASAHGQHQDKRLGPLVHSVRGTREDVA